jgi:hypothetical protein
MSWQAVVSKLDSSLNGLSWTLPYNYFARTTQKTQPLYCWEGMFTAPLHSNGSYSIVACVFFAPEMCLPSHCLAMNVYSDFSVPVFGRHVIVCTYVVCWWCRMSIIYYVPSALSLGLSSPFYYKSFLCYFLWVVLRSCEYRGYMASNGRMSGKWRIGKDLARSGRGRNEVLSRQLPGGHWRKARKTWTRQPASWPRLEPSVSLVQA